MVALKACCILLLAVTVGAQDFWKVPSGWSYADTAAWATNWPVCGSGKFQSPINIAEEKVLVHPGLMDLTVNYVSGPTDDSWYWDKSNPLNIIQRNGTSAATSTLMYGGVSWNLEHIRIHSPAEHTFNGVDYFPVEFEFVHTAPNGTTLSVSVMAALGEENENLPNPLFPDQTALSGFNPTNLLPTDLSYMVYEGSLSTPPCTQITQSIILKRNIMISSQQYLSLTAFGSQISRRPVQNIENRTVWFHQQSFASFTSQSSCQGISNFNVGLDGWTEFAASDFLIANVTWNKGKFAQGTPIPDANAITWSFASPIEMRGNLSHLIDGEIRYFIKPIVSPLFADLPGIDGDVVIAGTNKELFVRTSSSLSGRGNLYNPVAQWFTEYRIPFNDYSGLTWRVRPIGETGTNNSLGNIPTRQDWMDVLRYVRCISIRGRFNIDQSHTTWLDNVELCDGPNPVVPCPGVTNLNFRSQCSGNGRCLSGVCECNFGWMGDDCSIKKKCAVRHFDIPQSVINWKSVDEAINPIPPMQGAIPHNP